MNTKSGHHPTKTLVDINENGIKVIGLATNGSQQQIGTDNNNNVKFSVDGKKIEIDYKDLINILNIKNENETETENDNANDTTLIAGENNILDVENE